MEALLAGIEALPPVAWLRASRWVYATVNAGHIVGLALLFGAIVPLDLRLAGFWRGVPLDALARVLRPVAATGVALVLPTGAVLFAIRAREYAALDIFALKLALIFLALVNAALLRGPRLADASPRRLRLAGLLSIALWFAAIVAGRMLGYV